MDTALHVALNRHAGHRSEPGTSTVLGLSANDDPFVELCASACNVLGDTLGVRLCGAIGLDDDSLRGASSEFLHLPLSVQSSVITAITQAVKALDFEDDEAQSSRLVEVDLAPAIAGEMAFALLFPETETVVFAIAPGNGGGVPLHPLRRAAVLILPILYRANDLREERISLQLAESLLTHVEELGLVGGWEQVGASGRLLWSDQVYLMHGLEPGGEVTLDRMMSLYPSPAREKLALAFERAAAEGSDFDMTMPVRTPSGERRIVRTVGRTRTDASGRKIYGITQDVTTQMNAERRLWWAANHDPVTSLPNRLLFEDRLAVAMRKAKREERSFALVLIEVSDFARLTERSGYNVTDKHMMEVAARLATISRESDTLARVSINEFAILLNDVSDWTSLEPAVTRVMEEFDRMQKANPGGSGIVVSCGVAFYPTHAVTPDELVRAADMAAAQAKRKLDTPVVVFDRTIADDAAKRRETILDRARDSLARREFVPFYQPQVDIETNEVVGVEALVRWQTPDMLLDAKDFTYALDDHEIGSRVGRAVLDAVIEDVAKLRDVARRPFRVSINASRTEVLRNDFLDTFLERTRSGNLQPNDFIIEITEDVIIGVDDQTLHDKVSYLASNGVEFSLDDFGTGYASLIHITSFPIKEIKIDKQFIFGIETDRRKRAIVRGIIQIAQSMGLHVIAEGVETAEQEDALREIGCRYAQGYLYSFPVPFAQFADMLERR